MEVLGPSHGLDYGLSWGPFVGYEMADLHLEHSPSPTTGVVYAGNPFFSWFFFFFFFFNFFLKGYVGNDFQFIMPKSSIKNSKEEEGP
jgi:hypothetical protein